ncbi:cytochrome b561-like [Anneissia japonica]|uniref:cytochrome b561-like n=1 Tax=Anneissia japonica TaxID=1529436 RepID=UPI001425AD1B|nr:cytochrome b561-like [Anneissia japonica]XP_033097463.1 cytochrome b561-like [Anneissia japonica]XP_033097472.1 cytochrome b561-like [Anneissia japonica]XP_033097482.1 cytochrome b561-like [Anneissia japonica]XP_033097488.1 cytochrome b561-like [Anneissia japonica]XP_033097497.1 cytochrome b561-like [Anneissia japonica]XP_033097507.1 cytochrome b561-like [Anneissia japonica]XP_033097514.1 cytochrome b561-like [Anneissia japonica]
MASFLFVCVTFTQVVGVVMLVLLGYWTGNVLGGFKWDGSSQEFNLHPLLMVIGLVYMYGQAIMVYRVFSKESKVVVKTMHLMLQLFAFLCSCVGLKAVFRNHNVNNIANMYSLHSWIGLIIFILFTFQLVFGFLFFFFPKASESMRKAYLVVHRFFGVFIFAGAVGVACIGLLEKLGFQYPNDAAEPYDTLPSGAMIGNFLGLMIVLFGFLVGFVVTHSDFKRPDEPVEPEHRPLTTSEMKPYQASEAAPEP